MTCQPPGPSCFEAVHGTLHLPQRGLGAVEGKEEQADSNSNHSQAMHSIAAHICRIQVRSLAPVPKLTTCNGCLPA